MRSLMEIKDEIKEHETKITALKTEVKQFQKACPHPDTFLNKKQSTSEDEYGSPEETSYWAECVLCGASSKYIHVTPRNSFTFNHRTIIYEWN